MDFTRIVSGGTRLILQRGFLRPRHALRRRRLLYRIWFNAFVQRSTVRATIAPDVRIEDSIQIEVGRKTDTTLFIGPGSRLRFGSRLRLHGGTMHLGDEVDVRDGATLTVSGGALTVDGPTVISNGVLIHCQEWVHVQKHGLIAEYTTIADSAHFFSEPDVWSHDNSKSAPIDIGRDVWICPKVTIASGVTIGDYTIIGSNSAVIRDVPGGVLASGVPSVVVRQLDLPWQR